MSVTRGSQGVMTRPPPPRFGAVNQATIGNGRGRRNNRALNPMRVRVGGIRLGRPPMTGDGAARVAAAASQRHPCDQAFNATAVWRSCNLEGYLERKLHRQWRTRGS